MFGEDREIRIVQAEENAMVKMLHNAMHKVVQEHRPEFFVQEEVLTVEEAARYCKMSKSTLNNLVRNGDLIPHRPTGRPVFLKSELTEFIRRS